MNSPARRSDIDTMRCIACVLLVWYHVIGNDPYHGLRLAADHPFSVFNQALIYFRMPMFAFLSGVVYGFRPFQGDYRKFVSGKFRRLLVPMFIVGTALAILQSVIPGVNSEVDWARLHIIPVSHFWFVESMFLIFLVLMVVEGQGWLRHQAGLLIAIAVSVALSIGHVAAGIDYIGLGGAVYLCPYVLMGLWFSRFGARYPLYLFVASAVVALLGLVWQIYTLGGFPSRQSAVAFWASAALCLALVRYSPHSPQLARIGSESFAIYLFHPFFTGGVRILLKTVLSSPPLWLLVVAGLVVGLVGPILLAGWLRRHPVGRLVIGESTELMPNSMEKGSRNI